LNTEDSNGATGAEGASPQPGFTFADKRKVNAGATAKGDGEPTAEEERAVDGASAVPVAETGDKAIEEAEQLAAERLADLQRLHAEYANYRKRVERDRDLARDLAIASMVEALLPVLDDIHLARQHGDLETGPFVSIADKLETTLGRYGVERFGEPGVPFDPAVHDALMHVDEELAEGTEVTTVVGVLQPGYRVGDKVIRPARVSVADPH
jgi:molecular chaperone GrpE